MIRSKPALIGLCVVVLGVMAFAAGAAQAEVGAKWLILNSLGQVKTGSELPASLQAELENKTISLLTKVLGISVQILCTEIKLIGFKLEGNGSLTNGGKIHLNGCKVILNSMVTPECEIHSAGSPVGLVETGPLKGLLVLVGGSPLVRIEPKEGETILNFNMGAECPIGENLPFRGKIDLKDCENKIKEHLLKHLFEESPEATDIWFLNKTVEHKATIDGSIWLFLVGEHTGLKWAGDPA